MLIGADTIAKQIKGGYMLFAPPPLLVFALSLNISGLTSGKLFLAESKIVSL
jgi:hypothetical protein